MDLACATCIRVYCDERKNKYVLGCNNYLASYRGQVKDKGKHEKQFQVVKDILESGHEFSFKEISILAQRKLPICRQTVSKLVKDIGPELGYQISGHRIRRVRRSV